MEDLSYNVLSRCSRYIANEVAKLVYIERSRMSYDLLRDASCTHTRRPEAAQTKTRSVVGVS